MTETKLVRLDMDAYNILNQVKKQLNAELRKKKQAERITFSDVVRHLKNMLEP